MSSDNPDNSRRKFLSGSLTLVGGTGAAATLWPFLSSMAPSAKAKAAGAPVKVDISELKDGEKIDLIWRKKPIWVVKRTQKMLDSINTNVGFNTISIAGGASLTPDNFQFNRKDPVHQQQIINYIQPDIQDEEFSYLDGGSINVAMDDTQSNIESAEFFMGKK